MQEENFNLDYSNEFRDLHLNPAQFSQKLKRYFSFFYTLYFFFKRNRKQSDYMASTQNI